MTAILFSGAAFFVACLLALILFPAMAASDLFRWFKGCGRWMSFLPGAAVANLLLLPLQLNRVDGFSLMEYLKGAALFSLLGFGSYWGLCQVVDLISAKLLGFVRNKTIPE